MLRSQGQVHLVLVEKCLAGLWALALAHILGNLDIPHGKRSVQAAENAGYTPQLARARQAEERHDHISPWTSFSLHDGRRHKIFWPHLHSKPSLKKLLLQVQLSESSTVSKPLRSCCKGESGGQQPFPEFQQGLSMSTFPLGGLSAVGPSSAGRGLPGLLPPFLLWPMPDRQPGRNTPLSQVEKPVGL